ncbi:hypothetical protein RFI_38089, partial [Reticulomyxa filosa]
CFFLFLRSCVGEEEKTDTSKTTPNSLSVIDRGYKQDLMLSNRDISGCAQSKRGRYVQSPKVMSLEPFTILPDKTATTKCGVLFLFKKKKKKKKVKAIVLGVTGAGKTSLINLFYVWSKGLQRMQDIDKVLIPTRYLPGIVKSHTEMDSKYQNKSQTQGCTTYEFDLVYESTWYNLKFMDTPGLGDVEGIEKDDEHVQNILDTVSKTPELNSIVVMINGSDPRVSCRLTYVITKLIGMIPDICQQNLIVLLSNVSIRPNLDVKTLFSTPIPAEHVFYMNNEIFSIDPKTEEETTMNEANSLYETLKKKMKHFLDTASDMKITDTDEFRKLKEKRDSFKNQLMLLQKKCNELTEEKLRISNVITEVTQMTDQKQKLDLKRYKKQKRTQSEQEPTPYHSTVCCVCDSNCHEKCRLNETTVKGSEIFKRCTAMSGDHCKRCDHRYTSHVHMRVKWVKKEQLPLTLIPKINCYKA